ncbi:hypothetical protein D6Z43_27660 [Pseudomonas sp. DY-1]|uniref:hypothetical protein n=1 Tax=Pseudomonas sp. DY-1 TaxID=1755504 RepID=UPI000EAAB014|nr:hypothetical protein [Pseudomonas sp. DY-1]AYF85640.1 hypothetical protein D6Z43_00045 [Pseudomonas sp. DY-1]AYF85657.1 hypothetical protein D6Z43_00140 [Pseudomonas sp. DY-1]AYF85677.1 hypothetical protein D6Z43_00245 [Pseudomonas sp. DY-1]AYF85693.1 hypothetical protein D6Z43_00340 [Pseudomonas sp. DY-1]AYF90724.1 hypothetical protein D6Z43_27660 [Pseudomonas sp. DY-1]
MSAEVIAAIIGFCGVAFAAFLSSVGYLLKARVELKRSARLVLYYLMEIRYTINTTLIDPNSFYEGFMREVNKVFEARGIPVADPVIAELVEAAVYAHLSNMVGSIRMEIDEGLLVGYEESLKLLACEKPVLAYQLRGKERIQEAASHTIQYTEKLEKEIIPDISTGKVQDFLLSFSRSKKGESLNEVADMLDGDILMLAKNCGFLEYIKCKRALKKTSRLHENFDFSGIDEFLDTMMDSLKVFAQAQEIK